MKKHTNTSPTPKRQTMHWFLSLAQFQAVHQGIGALTDEMPEDLPAG